ncbi:MAG: zinc-ribbon domain-containing protein [Bacillota bacterium]|nr:zinc-ribbon domain-containing protein [Bacillota bacterium]
MFILFGWGKQTIKNEGPVLRYHCQHCNNDEFWQLCTRKTWFTLFFIPVIPYSTERLLVCPICKKVDVLGKMEYDKLKAIALCNKDLMNNTITEAEHEMRVKELLSRPYASSNDNTNISGKTQTQQNYLKQMQELEQERNNKG